MGIHTRYCHSGEKIFPTAPQRRFLRRRRLPSRRLHPHRVRICLPQTPEGVIIKHRSAERGEEESFVGEEKGAQRDHEEEEGEGDLHR